MSAHDRSKRCWASTCCTQRFGAASLGSAAAAYLATTRPGARAAVLMQGAPQPAMWGTTTWPNVPVQLHYAEADPWVTASDVESLATMVKAGGAPFEAFVYPGSGHLFADEGLPDYDAASTEKMLARFLKFVS